MRIRAQLGASEGSVFGRIFKEPNIFQIHDNHLNFTKVDKNPIFCIIRGWDLESNCGPGRVYFTKNFHFSIRSQKCFKSAINVLNTRKSHFAYYQRVRIGAQLGAVQRRAEWEGEPAAQQQVSISPHCCKYKYKYKYENKYKYKYKGSLGALRAPTSSWGPFGPLDFVLRALRALRLCDPRSGDWIVR